MFWIHFDVDTSLSSFYYSLRGQTTPPANVVVVGIDDDSYTVLKAFTKKNPGSFRGVKIKREDTLPRPILAEAIRNIHAAEPKILIQDFYVDELDENPEYDRELAKAMATGITVLGKGALHPPDEPLSKDIYDEKNLHRVVDSEAPFKKAASMEIFMNLNRSQFSNTVSRIVLIPDSNLSPEQRIPLLKPLQQVVNADFSMPSYRDEINFYGGPGHLNFIALHELLVGDDKNKKLASLKDKIVLLGYQSIMKGKGNNEEDKSKDQFEVPSSSNKMYGVEIHATIASNLLENNFLRRAKAAKEWSGIFIGMFVLLWSMTKIGSRLFVFIYPLAFSIAWLLLGYFAFAKLSFFIPGGLLCLYFSFVVITLKALTNYNYLLGNFGEVDRITR